MTEIIIQIIAACAGCLGFCLIFNVSRKHILTATVGGLITWVIYLILQYFGFGVFQSSLISSAIATCYAEIMAKVKKCPATPYIIIALIPLIPGSGLYYSMSSAVQGNSLATSQYASSTLQFALGLAAGMSLVIAFRTIQNYKNKARA